MLKERRTLYLTILVLLVIAVFACIVRGSEAFKQCFREKERDQYYSAIQERHDIVSTSIARLTLNADCSLTFFDSGAITALATLVIAGFTGTLWLSTNRLWKVSIDEFNAAHRPRLIVRDVILDRDKIRYLLINSGDASATVVESHIVTELIYPEAPVRPIWSAGFHDLDDRHFDAGETKLLTFQIIPDFIQYFRRSPAPTDRVDFTGTIVYTDRSGTKRRTVFRRSWLYPAMRFYRHPDPDQEYSD
jgi:hypothetical protein